jgi:hypothetical protein
MYSYWHLREIEHEALQRMYLACRKGRDFPGTLPDETSGRVTTHAILQGLGLIGADDDESMFQDILNKSPSSGVQAVGPRQKGATRPAPPSSCSSMSDHSTATSRSQSFDTPAPPSIPITQQTIPFNESWYVDLGGSTKQGYLATLDSSGQPWPINFSLQEAMPKQAKAQQIMETPIFPTALGGQSMTSQFIDFDSASSLGFFDELTQDPMSWCTNLYDYV